MASIVVLVDKIKYIVYNIGMLFKRKIKELERFKRLTTDADFEKIEEIVEEIKKKFHVFYIRTWKFTEDMKKFFDKNEEILHFSGGYYDEIIVATKKRLVEKYKNFLETEAEIYY